MLRGLSSIRCYPKNIELQMCYLPLLPKHRNDPTNWDVCLHRSYNEENFPWEEVADLV